MRMKTNFELSTSPIETTGSYSRLPTLKHLRTPH
jgi:hypothetical protein